MPAVIKATEQNKIDFKGESFNKKYAIKYAKTHMKKHAEKW